MKEKCRGELRTPAERPQVVPYIPRFRPRPVGASFARPSGFRCGKLPGRATTGRPYGPELGCTL